MDSRRQQPTTPTTPQYQEPYIQASGVYPLELRTVVRYTEWLFVGINARCDLSYIEFIKNKVLHNEAFK